MKYKASVYLKKADTAGRVPASVLDEFVRTELLGQIGTALKPHLIIQQADVTDGSQSVTHTERVDFTTELIILPTEQWNHFRDQFSQWFISQDTNKSSGLLALFDALENSRSNSV